MEIVGQASGCVYGAAALRSSWLEGATMKEFLGKVAVITGAASGIGHALAERCFKKGMKVVLADIDEEALNQTQNEPAKQNQGPESDHLEEVKHISPFQQQSVFAHIAIKIISVFILQ